MGYTTYFSGDFSITPALKPEHLAYLRMFVRLRHANRDPKAVEHIPDPIREAAGLPVGEHGAYFVAYGPNAPAPDLSGKTLQEVEAILNAHRKDNGINDEGPGVLRDGYRTGILPGYWCQWTPNDEGTALAWDEGEKFYSYREWLEFLIDHFLKPWGYTVAGMTDWNGEESGDTGTLFVANNIVFIGTPVPECCVKCGHGTLTIKGNADTGEKRTCVACNHTIVVHYTATGWDNA